MGHVIEVAVTGDPKAVVDKAKTTAQKFGAVFEGDHVAGKFSGNGIEGRYEFSGKLVVVTIDRKPDFAPMPMVESAIRGFFEAGPSTDLATTTGVDEIKRRERADALIRRHVVWSSGAGLIPIPLADIAAVTAVQVNLLRDLTKLYNSELPEPVLENFVTALTGGMFARIGASAVKAIPGIGSLLGGASMSIMSGASTYAVGRVAKRHLEMAGSLAKVDLAVAKREYRADYERGKEYVTKLEDDPPKPSG